MKMLQTLFSNQLSTQEKLYALEKLGTTEDNAKSQIIMRFRIPEEEAVKYIKTFWKSEK